MLRPHGHIQIIGEYTVNFYAFTTRGHRYYVNGMARGQAFDGDADDLVALAFRPVPQPKSANRHKGKMSKKDSTFKRRLWANLKRCHWCGRDIENYEEARLDHIIPLANGGSNGHDNLTIACIACDTDKGAKMPYNFKKGR